MCTVRGDQTVVFDEMLVFHRPRTEVAVVRPGGWWEGVDAVMLGGGVDAVLVAPSGESGFALMRADGEQPVQVRADDAVDAYLTCSGVLWGPPSPRWTGPTSSARRPRCTWR
jgi:hypothetical protein